MKLTQLLDRRLILLGREIASQEEVIDLLVDLMCTHTELRGRKKAALDAVMEREALGGTTFPTGIAIPHGRIPGFQDMLIGLCVPARPIQVRGIDVRMIVLILASTTPAAIYLNTLAALARLSKDAPLFERLSSSASIHDLYEVLERANIEVKHSFTVRDVMNSDLHTVSPETPLKEAIDLLYRHRTAYAPVVDATGRFVGEVTVNELLGQAIPDYAESMPNLRFLSEFAPLDYLLGREDQLAARDVMRQPAATLSPEDSVIHAAFELHHHKRRHLPVVEDRRVVGVVSTMDLLDKVLRR